jgi:phosphomannomutase
MSILGHIPEGDGIMMGLLLIEIVAASHSSLAELVEKLLKEVGPSHYQRIDLRLAHPVSKEKMKQTLLEKAPPQIGGIRVEEISSLDGVKYILADDSWLLIRPSGTEPVLRVYAEGRSVETMEALMAYGEEVAARTA